MEYGGADHRRLPAATVSSATRYNLPVEHGRPGILFAAAIVLLIGGFLLKLGVGNAWNGWASRSWPRTESVVTRSESTTSTSRDTSGRATSRTTSAEIEFRYVVNGREYSTGTRHFGQTVGSSDSSEAEILRRRYAAGTRHLVAYNPASPDVAAAEPGLHPDLLWLLGIGFAFSAPALFACVLVWRPGDHMGYAVAGMGWLFTLLGCAGLLAGCISLWRAHQSLGWPEAAGEIVYGVMDVHPSLNRYEEDGGVKVTAQTASYAAAVVYRYAVGSRMYHSNVRRFGQLAGAGADWAADITARYPKGARLPVRYNPAQPDEAVMEPGWNSEGVWLPGASAMVLLFGLAVLGPGRRALSGAGVATPPARLPRPGAQTRARSSAKPHRPPNGRLPD